MGEQYPLVPATLARPNVQVKNESEVEQWISKYDLDVGEKDTELSALRGVYEDEQVSSDGLGGVAG